MQNQNSPLDPSLYIHPTTHVLAAAMRAAQEHGCSSFWMSDLAAFLGSESNIPAAYALNGHLPGADIGNPYPHYSGLRQAFIDVDNHQLVAAVLALTDNAPVMPALVDSATLKPITVDGLRETLRLAVPLGIERRKAA